jgi:predicted nucleic acid-binding protein
VGAGLILETTFLIDLERELLRSEPGAAHAFLQGHGAEPLYLTFTVAGELAAGYGADGRGRWEALVAPFHVLPCTLDVCWHYGRAERHLRANGMLIGANDLWIGATGLAHGMAVVTRNLGHYRRIPGLEVVGY